ncbi:unnamed protein product [Microthlaspi erraticum]|uniref:UDP-glycosyltransferases domain-containing protein n=1 Tax=Microthlaspi erraticum TaxID=1685480 RepID=A0A6D2HD84_9BRAS|nr:unnamed protein product [Microthlaspi erraticum]CAA7036705.1 unnamed protein product [Microthlaspi erraticum]CAA7036707.1 unnamed protein product [Microthlaspi erraticum]
MEKRQAKRRIVLVPLPVQGHVTPFMQLGKALYMKGFSVTVVQGHFHQVSSSSQQHDFPGFQFITIPESLQESEFERLGPIEFMMTLNKTSEASFKDCIGHLMVQHGNDISCIIYDEFMYFSEAAAKEFKLPSVVFNTSSATNQACRTFLSKVNAEKFLANMEDHEVQDKVVENLHPLRYNDLPVSGLGPVERVLDLCKEAVKERRAFAVIINTVSCLENSSLTWLEQELGIPVYS